MIQSDSNLAEAKSKDKAVKKTKSVKKAPARRVPITLIQNACSSSERVHFSNKVPYEWQHQYSLFQKNKLSEIQGFAEALSLRKLGLQGESMVFSEFWLANSLYRSKLYHMAHQAFSAVASRQPTEETLPIQIASLRCINMITHQFPSMHWNKRLEARLFELQNGLESMKSISRPLKKHLQWILWDTAGAIFRATQDTRLLSILKDSGPHEAFARALLESTRGNTKKAALYLIKFKNYRRVPYTLRRYQTTATLLLARHLYELGDYQRSANYLHQVTKSSNEIASVLTELAWAKLMQNNLGEAVGAAMSLNSGGLEATFAPEAPMVMAMALNELCQYPHSIRAIDLFRTQYKEPYHWLKQWRKRAKKKDPKAWNLYPTAIRYLKGSVDVPEKVVSEWIRSPLFLSSQSEINLLIDENNRGKKFSETAQTEQVGRAKKLLAELRKLRTDYQKAKILLEPGESISTKIINRLYRYRDQMKHFYRLRAAAPFWNKLLKVDQMRGERLRERLIHQINNEFMRANLRMVQNLDFVAENNQLIEVEIFNGASKDIVWQNAHPDYEKVAEEIKDQKEEKNSDQVWNWGTSEAGLEGTEEVWEDELGTFRADIYNNCSSKDKYLAIKSKLIRERTLVKMKKRKGTFSISSKSKINR